MSNNKDSNSGGEFHASVQRDEPLTTHGHQPGKMVGNDAAPEFTAQVVPPGSAPADRTFRPNNENEIVQTNDENADPEAPRPTANDFPGATSGDVHTGLGQPIQGQSSSELRHDGKTHRKHEGGGGLEGLKSGAQGDTVDARLPENAGQRAIDNEEAQSGQRGNVGGPPAQERVPDSA